MLWLLPYLVACVDPGPDNGPMPRYDISSIDDYAQPWPGDQHLDADGTISFAAFEDVSNIGLIDTYLAIGEQQVGWGTNSPVHFSVVGELDRSRLPTPHESLLDDSAILLVDVDPRSPFFGERFPVVWRAPGLVTSYQPAGLLSIAPLPGFPLRGGTTYALLLTEEGFAVNPDFQAVFEPGHPHFPLWENVRDTLPLLGLDQEHLACGSIFTTTDPVGEMAKLARFVQTRLAPPQLDQVLEHLDDYGRFTAYRGRYPSPVFTHGERPYVSRGGEFRYDALGDPIISQWDDLRLAVCVPVGQQQPPGGWPVVIYQHGTGGNYRGMCDGDAALEAGGVIAEAGFVTLGIDQPLHGPRLGQATSVDLVNFNIVNPSSAITNFRQGALDAIYLARTLARRTTTFTLPDGQTVRLDGEQVHFVGHSQGGLTGALAAPFWAGDVKGTVLSGAGGVLSITIVDRDDILDFANLVAQIARFQPDEEVHELHPVVGMMQGLVEPTDPVNYAPYWFHDRLDIPGHQPASVLMTNGTNDANTPYRTAIAMAVAARAPVLSPRASTMDAMDLRGLSPQQSPQQANADGFNGPITSGFLQWRDGSHFIIFQEPEVAAVYQDYLRTSAQGAPRIAWPEGNP